MRGGEDADIVTTTGMVTTTVTSEDTDAIDLASDEFLPNPDRSNLKLVPLVVPKSTVAK